MRKSNNAQDLMQVFAEAGEPQNKIVRQKLQLVKAALPLESDYKVFRPTPFTNGSTLKKSAFFFATIVIIGLLGDLLDQFLSWPLLNWSNDLLTAGLIGFSIILLLLLIEATDRAAQREVRITHEAIFRVEKGSVQASAWLKDLKFINQASSNKNLHWDVYFLRGHDGGVELSLSSRYWRNKDIKEISNYLNIPIWERKNRQS